MEQSEKEGKSLADLLKVEMQNKPLEFIKAISAYTPKEIDISDDRDVSEMSEQELDERIARLSAAIEARLSGAAEDAGSEAGDQEGPRIASRVH